MYTTIKQQLISDQYEVQSYTRRMIFETCSLETIMSNEYLMNAMGW